jgi:hypothetical protein
MGMKEVVWSLSREFELECPTRVAMYYEIISAQQGFAGDELTSYTERALGISVNGIESSAVISRSIGGSVGIFSFAACSGDETFGWAVAKPSIAHAGFVNTYKG